MTVRRLLAAVVGVALAAGCATVPTSGPINTGPIVDPGQSEQFVRVIAAPPSAGASPGEIVRGFIEACASLEDDWGIARRYLTEEAAAAWDASASTTVLAQDSLEIDGDGRVVDVGVRVTAELHADGTLTHVDPPQAREIPFRLARVEDPSLPGPQWRIADLPEGVLISDADVRGAFRPYSAFWVSGVSGVLVPDVRLLPVIGPSLPTALAEVLLDGPADWLAPGVRSGFPAGTALALDAVPVEDGVAVVALSDQALLAADDARRDMAAQLTWTLTQLPGVAAVRLQSGGTALEVPGLPETMDRQDWQARAPDSRTLGPSGDAQPPSYALVADTIVRTTQGGTDEFEVDVPAAGRLADLAVALDGRLAAAASGSGDRLWLLPLVGDGEAREVTGERVGGISFDLDHRAWFVDAGRVRRVGPSGAVDDVAVRGSPLSDPITRLALARDGSRVAVVAGGLLYVGAIEARDEGRAIRHLGRTDSTVSGVEDVAWRDSQTLEVIGALNDSGTQVVRVALGSGQARGVGSPPEPRDVAAAPGARSLVATGSGELFGNVGLQWRDQGPARSVAYPG